MLKFKPGDIVLLDATEGDFIKHGADYSSPWQLIPNEMFERMPKPQGEIKSTFVINVTIDIQVPSDSNIEGIWEQFRRVMAERNITLDPSP